MHKQVRGEYDALYISESGKSYPIGTSERLAQYNAEDRPIWKSMHIRPTYRMNGFITREGNGRAKTNAYISGSARGKGGRPLNVGTDTFRGGLYLPSDNRMTVEQQEVAIEIIRRCFYK